jgi:PAS domain S-box-containing protein
MDQTETGFSLDRAFQGPEGLELVRRSVKDGCPYIMAFVDVRMPPGWDGIETISRFWEVDPGLQAVICTAYSDYSWEELTAKLDQPDKFVILKKPFDNIEVLQLANSFTEKWQLQRQVEERALKLRESEQRYQFLAEAMPGIVWTATPDGRIDYANEHLRLYSGRPFEQNKDHGWHQIVHPDDRELCLDQWADSIRSGKPYQVEYRLKRASDGAYRWHLGRAVPMRNDQGEILHWVGASIDIDDQKKAQSILQQAQADLERRVAERTNELRLQTSALEATENGVVITDPAGQVLWVNPAFTKLTGYSAAEVVGRTPAILKSGRHDAPFYAAMWNTILDGKVWHGEILDRRKDGTDYCAEMTITPVLDKNGKVQNFVAVKQDRSQRKEFELALARERDLLQSLMDNIPDFIYFKDTQSRFVRINQSHAHALGLAAPADAIGKTDTDFFLSHFARQTLVDEMRMLTTGEPILDKEEHVDTTYGKMWVSATKVPLRDKDGRITGLVGVSRNTTERKQVEEELRAQRESFRALTDNAPDAIARIDRDLRFVYANRVLLDRLGIPASEVLGKTCAELHMAAHEEWHEAVRRVFETGQTTTFEFQAEGKSGTRFHEARLLPEHSPHGGVVNVLAITRDVTSRKHSEKEQQIMELQLRQAQKLESIGQLAAGIAHEINTPTQYVGDNTQFLKDSFENITKVMRAYEELFQAVKNNSVTPGLTARIDESVAAADLGYLFEQIPAAIKETLEGVERVTRIVRAMKEFSHPGGKEKSPADLNKAIETTVTVARNEWKYVADLALELDPALPPVPCFVGEFNQCILNLVVNAAHAIGDVIKQQPGTKGTITVRTRRDGDHALISVSDTGTGIAKEHRSKIFEPFFTTKDVGKGTGQGLNMVYCSIVKKHGGTATFESEVGKGTTFILQLPLGPSQPQPAQPPQ